MAGVSMYPVRTLICGLAVMALMQPLEGSIQERPAVAGRDDWKTDFTRHTVPFDEFASGGPPKDGIRSIDRPSFVTIRAADEWLSDRDPVALVSLNGDGRSRGRRSALKDRSRQPLLVRMGRVSAGDGDLARELECC